MKIRGLFVFNKAVGLDEGIHGFGFRGIHWREVDGFKSIRFM